jgi:hypothetical protein
LLKREREKVIATIGPRDERRRDAQGARHANGEL